MWVPARPSAQAAALRRVFGPMVPTSSGGPPSWTGAGPTGSTDSVIFEPAHTRFMTATRSAMPRMVCVAGSAPTA
jgi:hypothetical protein